MNRTIKYFVYLLWCFLVVLISCQKEVKPVTEITTSRTYQSMVLKLSLEPKEVTLPAELKPFEQVKIYSRVSGYLRKVYVDIGSRVTAGELLAEIDAPEQQLRLAELNERMHNAYTQFLASKDESDRAIELAKTPGTIAIADVIRLNHKKVADSLTWEAIGFSMQNAQEMINYQTIRSPFSGVVTGRYVDAGELVGVNNQLYLFEIENNSWLRLEVPVPETYSTASLQGKDATFNVPSMPGREFKANFSRRGNSLTENTKSEIWQFDFPNPGNKLKSGMYANVKMKLVRSDSTFVIPSSALVTTLEKQYVIKLEADTARLVPVKTGFYFKDRVEVFGDLRAGNVIVCPASDKIAEGEVIKVE